MEVTCTKKHLQEASLLSEKIASHNPTLPILSSVLVSTDKSSLSFLSTNLETSLKISIPAKIEKNGEVALSAKLFSNFISSLPDHENVKFNVVNNNLILTTSNSSTTIKCYPVKDFPILPKIKEKKSFKISLVDFVLGIKSVYYSTSLLEMKPEINSVFVTSSKNKSLTFVATDSFRLAEKTIHCNFSDSLGFLVPYKSVVEMLRIFENQGGDLRITLDENNLVLNSDYMKFTSRLVGGNFLDYKQFVPVQFANTATLNKKQLSNALKTAVMFGGKLNEIKIKIYKNESFLEVQTTNPDLGEHVVRVPAKVDGEDLTMVFNHRYLTDCLSSLFSDEILFKFAGEGNPLLITGLDDSSFCYIIMPMKDV